MPGFTRDSPQISHQPNNVITQPINKPFPYPPPNYRQKPSLNQPQSLSTAPPMTNITFSTIQKHQPKCKPNSLHRLGSESIVPPKLLHISFPTSREALSERGSTGAKRGVKHKDAGFVTRVKREAHAKRAIQQKHTLCLQHVLSARSEHAKRGVSR